MLAARCYSRRKGLGRCGDTVGGMADYADCRHFPDAGGSLSLTAQEHLRPYARTALVGALAFLLPQDSIPGDRWRGLTLCGVSLTVAALVHPLMAGYALACVLGLGAGIPWSRKTRALASIGLCIAGVGTAMAIQRLSLPESMPYLSVAMTRRYWFLSEWQWYEWIGVAAPLLILGWIAMARRSEGREPRIILARMAVVVGGIAVAVAMLFARVGMTTHLVARLQPLRVFQLVYVVMILAVGAELTERVLQRRVVRWVAVFGALATVMVLAERQTFPASSHIELPPLLQWTPPSNAWVQALWDQAESRRRMLLLALDAD